MEINVVFNLTVCLLGVLILLIHIVNILLKRNRRKDENALFIFFIFTMVHFATYFTFTLINYFLNKNGVYSDTLIITFYTIFYIMNNVEAFLFYRYLSCYLNFASKAKKIADIVNLTLFCLIIASDIINIFTHMYFTSNGGHYARGDYLALAQSYQVILLAISFVVILLNKSLNIREKIGFSFYVFLPAIAIVIQIFLPGYAIAYASMLIAVEILFLFLNVEKNIRLEEDERKLKDVNVKLMMSQIQPHFVYNALSSISTLITIDPHKAQKALDEFTDYVRMNFSALTDTHPVAFTDELRHIKTYVDLEKLRFNERLNVIYNIQVFNFDVPALSVQPIVENAIKHGVMKKIEGGTVKISTYEDVTSYVVVIEDDGVGFDINDDDLKTNKHIGLSNVKHRINSMCKGDIKFESEKNKGTKVTISFYKE